MTQFKLYCLPQVLGSTLALLAPLCLGGAARAAEGDAKPAVAPKPVAAKPNAPAQPSKPSPSVAAAPRDVVTTKSGSVITGWVARYAPASYVIVKTESASVMVAAPEVLSVAFADRGPESGIEVAARLMSENTAPAVASAPAASAAPAAPAAVAAPTVAVAGSAGAVAASARGSIHLTTPATSGGVSVTDRPKSITQRAWVETKTGTAGRSTTGPDGATTTSQASLKQGTLSHEQVAANGDRSSTKLNAFRKSASHESSTSCADPSDPMCSRGTKVSVGADGLGAELTETHVAAVKTPPKGYWVVGLDAGVMGITGDAISGFGGQTNLGFRGAAGGQLPDGKGGGWSGLGLELALGLSMGKMQLETFAPRGGIQSTEVEYQLGSIGAAAGWQYLHFGKLDPETLRQSGFGLFLGYRVAGNQILNSKQTDPQLSHGPQIGISFPTYNAGTASVSELALKGMILPMGETTLFQVTLGYGF